MQENYEYVIQAFELKKQKCYKQAIEMLYKYLESGDENVNVLFLLGELYYLLNNFSRAEQYLEKVLALDENHMDALKLKEKIYSHLNDFSSALKISEKIFEISDNNENFTELVSICAKSGNIDKIKELEKFENSDDFRLYAIAKAYYDNNMLSLAKEKLNKAIQLNDINEDVRVLLGKIYFDESEFEKSREIFNTFSLSTENPEVLNYLGLFATEDLKFIEAIKYFSKASAIEKNNHKYFYNLANAYFYNGWFKEAENSYKKAICLAPENCGYRYSLAYLYYEQKNFEKAQKEIDYILEKNYEYAHVLNALLKFERKDFLGAQKELEDVLQKNSDNFVLVSLAKVYRELSMFEKAENLINQVLKNNPKSLNYKLALAQIYISRKKYSEAIKIIEDVINENENYIQAYSLGAEAAYKSEDFSAAKNYAQNAIALDMNFAPGYYYLALVRFEEKDFDEALECMKRAIMFEVNNAEYYAKMSEIYRAKQDYKSAFDYIKEAESISGSTEYRILYKELASLCRNGKI